MSASITNIFDKSKLVNKSLRASPKNNGHNYPVVTAENTSLALAGAQQFDRMCKDILWGSEKEKMQDFGEMLRGIIVCFLPTNRYHLQLLKHVARATWELDRIGIVQQNLFEASNGSVGKYRLPTGTLNAMEFGEGSSKKLKDLQKAINTYQAVRGSDKR